MRSSAHPLKSQKALLKELVEDRLDRPALDRDGVDMAQQRHSVRRQHAAADQLLYRWADRDRRVHALDRLAGELLGGLLRVHAHAQQPAHTRVAPALRRYVQIARAGQAEERLEATAHKLEELRGLGQAL